MQFVFLLNCWPGYPCPTELSQVLAQHHIQIWHQHMLVELVGSSPLTYILSWSKAQVLPTILTQAHPLTGGSLSPTHHQNSPSHLCFLILVIGVIVYCSLGFFI